MRVLALFSNDNGVARSAVVDLQLGGVPYERGVNDPAFNPASVADELNDYNDGGNLFIVALPDGAERPDVVDQNGDEVSADFIEVDLA